MRVTGLAQRAAWRTRKLPLVEQVRPGLWSVPVPIPDSPLRYTLTYLLGTDDGLVVVDPGWDTDAGWQALLAGLAEAGVPVGEVAGVIVTHVHPDHHGLSRRVRDASGAWVAMHPAEREWLLGRPGGMIAEAQRVDRDWLRVCGVPDEVAAEVTVGQENLDRFREMAQPDVLLEHGERVPVRGRVLRAVWTPGHTPGHLCLHDETENVLLTGDHVLPRITPNVGLHTHAGGSPLADYLDSLRAMAPYDSAEAFPAHEFRFAGLAARVAGLLAHHDRRCQEIIDTLERLGAATIWQVAQHLSWSRGWAGITGFMRRAAVAETAAHLVFLTGTGRVKQLPDEPDAPWRYLGQQGDGGPGAEV